MGTVYKRFAGTWRRTEVYDVVEETETEWIVSVGAHYKGKYVSAASVKELGVKLDLIQSVLKEG